MTTDDADAREQRDATALSETLEGRSADAPQDALEAAALIRHGGGELPEARSEAILAGLLETMRPPQQEPIWSVRWLRWLVPLGAVAAAAFLIALPGAPEPTDLTRPGLALLEAQGAVLRDANVAPLEHEMRGYRRDVHAALSSRYGESP